MHVKLSIPWFITLLPATNKHLEGVWGWHLAFHTVAPGFNTKLLIIPHHWQYLRLFDYIPLLGLSIPTEFALSDSSKTVPWASCMLRTQPWLRLDNILLFSAFLYWTLLSIFQHLLTYWIIKHYGKFKSSNVPVKIVRFSYKISFKNC